GQETVVSKKLPALHVRVRVPICSPPSACLAGHIGLEPANPGAGQLIGFAWQFRLRAAPCGWRRPFACQLYDAHLRLGPSSRQTIFKRERRTASWTTSGRIRRVMRLEILR